jgi:hypothetical protein
MRLKSGRELYVCQDCLGIDPDLNVYGGHDDTLDDRVFRLGLRPGQIPPERFFAEYPDEEEDLLTPAERLEIADEALLRWAKYRAEALVDLEKEQKK